MKQQSNTRQNNEWSGMEFHIDEKDMRRLNESYVGNTKEHEGAFGLQKEEKGGEVEEVLPLASVLKEKLKKLKLKLKSWNWEVYGNVDQRVKKLEEEISILDIKAESGGLSESEVGIRRSKFVELWEATNAKESLLRQKSRVKWLQEGDSNSSYFHANLVVRRRRSQLVAIKVEDLW